MLEFRSGGRRVSQNEFFENLKRQAIQSAMKELQQRAYGAAASIIDPETGKHADVFVRQRDETSLILSTSGSPAFARELEKRLGIAVGSIETSTSDAIAIGEEMDIIPRLYLAHASEDHDTLAKPLAEKLMAEGIEVWFDEWEIRAGDSLRRKMEEGLSNCTHFLVLLTPHSLSKAWVQTEVDAGFIRAVGGESRFIGVRLGVRIEELSPFLRTLRCPELRLDKADELAALISDIYGVSRKPLRGPAPRYVQAVPEGLTSWSRAALAIAEHITRTSEHGIELDPQLDLGGVAQATGLSEEDVRLGVLDLADAGLIKTLESMMGIEGIWPTSSFFVEFDKHFLGLDSKRDALAVAAFLVNQNCEGAHVQELAGQFPEWSTRRLNSALNYLDDANLVQSIKALDSSPHAMTALRINDRTRRFVRDHA
jgi:hypothetical protein